MKKHIPIAAATMPAALVFSYFAINASDQQNWPTPSIASMRKERGAGTSQPGEPAARDHPGEYGSAHASDVVAIASDTSFGWQANRGQGQDRVSVRPYTIANERNLRVAVEHLERAGFGLLPLPDWLNPI